MVALGGGGGSARTTRRSSRRSHSRMSEINVTPFVDVMLVLLVVFMVTAPLLAVGVPVNLPKTKAGALGQDNKPLTISVRKDGEIYLQESPIGLDDLVAKLRVLGTRSSDLQIYVRGDQAIEYGRVMEVMGVIQAGGFTRVALVTEPVGR